MPTLPTLPIACGNGARPHEPPRGAIDDIDDCEQIDHITLIDAIAASDHSHHSDDRDAIADINTTCNIGVIGKAAAAARSYSSPALRAAASIPL